LRPFLNVDYANVARPDVVARTDYAGNGGDVFSSSKTGWGLPYGPSSFPDEENNWIPNNEWLKWGGNVADSTGIFGIHFNRKTREIVDGTSHTYLIAERYVDPSTYNTGISYCNDQGWNMGYDYDINRWTTNDSSMTYQPMRDRSGFEDGYNFGSAHALVFNAVFCDGSVHPMKYSLEAEVHRQLGSCMDRQPIDNAQLW
jgi:hypothetical protein